MSTKAKDTEEVHAAISKMMAETAKLSAETAKINTETRYHLAPYAASVLAAILTAAAMLLGRYLGGG